MGRWSFLPFVADDPKPEEKAAPRASSNTSGMWQPGTKTLSPKSAPKAEPKAAAPKSGGLPGWTPPANMPAPPQASQGTAIPKPKEEPVNSVRDWLHQPGGLLGPEEQPAPLTDAQKAAPPDLSVGMQNLLNSQNWQLPTSATQKGGGMPDTSFEKGSLTDLHEHDYTISSDEWDRIQNTYSTPGAGAAGYSKPADANLNQNMPLMQLGEQESAALTWEAYDALSSDQKAAVDFNTLLIPAREEDLGKSQFLNEADRATYDAKVTELFGEGGGSDVLAPATVDLLSQLDMNFVGQDLDEYLSLDRGISSTELMDFKFSDKDAKTLGELADGAAGPTYEEVRAPENIAAIDTAAIQKGQQLIKTALANPEALTYDFNSLMFGPSAEIQLAGQPPIGFGTETTQWSNPDEAALNSWYQKGLSTLGAADPTQFGVPAGADPMSYLLADMEQNGGGPEDQQKFLDYIANQVSLIGQYGTPEDATMAAMITKRAGLGG